jgi:SAM-dependent methyltransferase
VEGATLVESRREPDREVVRVRIGDGASTPLLFWEEPGAVFVMPSSTATRWLNDALRTGGCTLTWPDGRTESCSTELLVDARAAGHVRERMRTRYGPAVYDRYFGPRSKVVRLTPGGKVNSRTPDQLLVQEFDAVAAGYLAAVQDNRIEYHVNVATRDRLLTQFRGRQHLLEIGAGIGFETLPLLASGHAITVVDLSPRMLENLTAGATAAGVAAGLSSRIGRLSRLDEALQDVPASSFDGAYSTFGAFNLESSLGSAPTAFARVLRPGSLLVFTTLNRPGLLPVLWEAVVGNRVGALRRAQHEMPAGTVRYPLSVYPRNPTWWDRALAPHFRRIGTLPVSVMAPPFESPRLVRWFGPTGGSRVLRWDARLSRRAALAPLGEWSYLVFERRTDPPP